MYGVQLPNTQHNHTILNKMMYTVWYIALYTVLYNKLIYTSKWLIVLTYSQATRNYSLGNKLTQPAAWMSQYSLLYSVLYPVQYIV